MQKIESTIKQRVYDLSQNKLEILYVRLNDNNKSFEIKKKLIAYIVGNNNMSISCEELQEHINLFLPNYMVPQEMNVVEKIPISPNGKIDLIALSLISNNISDAQNKVHIKPNSEVEKAVASMWSNILDVEKISINDDFFSLGGDSMMSAKLIADMREAFEAEIPLRYLFEAPTISGLSRLMLNDDSICKIIKQNASLIAELDNMSDEEIELLLSEEESNLEEKFN